MLPSGPQPIYQPDINFVKKQFDEGRMDSFPYWSKLWPAAVAISTYLEQHSHLIKSKKVLELAAGLGLPSLVSARYAAEVICTDLDEDAVKIAHLSALHCGIKNMRCEVLNWNNIPNDFEADTVLLSDVNYDANDFPDLLRVIQNFRENGTQIMLATPQRMVAKSFAESLLPFCKEQEMISATAPNGLTADVSILIL